MSNRTLYHVTPTRNLITIEKDGIDPTKSMGKQMVSWYVSWHNVAWAIYHVQRRHGVSLSEITVITVRISERQLIKTAKRGVWTCRKLVCPHLTSPALDLIPDPLERKLNVHKY